VGDPDATEWVEVAGVGSVFRRRGGPALLAAPMPIGAEMKRMMPALWSFDARGWLSTLRVPALVMCGGADPVVPVSHAGALHQAIRGASWVEIDGAGHVPSAERRPQAGDAIRRFLGKL
jgi:pimeloyl-ACP methyl ester carboxylesterase